MKNRISIIIIILTLFFNQYIGNSQVNNSKPTQDYILTLKKISDVMVTDVTSPMAAARYYGYITLSAYEVLAAIEPDLYPSFSGELKFPPIKISSDIDTKSIDIALAVNFGLLKSAEKLLPSGPTLDSEIQLYKDKFASVSGKKEMVHHSLKMASEVAEQIVKWAKTDGFLQLNNLQRYTPKNTPGSWAPTGPAFTPALEPHWGTLRPFLLDSAQQFKPQPPAPYSTDKNSSFFQLVKETADVVDRANKKEQEIADYWDDNPFAVQQIGHVEFGIKKISPGGHWMCITGLACKKRKMGLKQTILTHLLAGIAMHDAFIACWDEKYRSDRVRPQTVIQQHINPRWKPYLQTPPFPEYVSGHSVVSSTISVVLTQIFGDNFSYTDDTVVEFGMKKRKFKSFFQAAEEASISRLYGGIHFRDGIEQGVMQGKEIGKWSILRIKPYYNLISLNKG